MPKLPSETPQALADQVQAAGDDAIFLRSLHFDKRYLFAAKQNRCVFRLEQTGEEVSAGLYNLWPEKGRMIESRRATNAALWYLAI